MATQQIYTLPSLPPYPQMIMAALDELNEEMGSNKTSISKYIESKYPNLPASHTSLLRDHLSRMKDTGELIFWKNNYMKPNPNFIRRGRGRPRKEPGMEPSHPPKPKARPRNDEYGPGGPMGLMEPDLHEKKKKVSSSQNNDGPPVLTKTGRPRGRPRKVKPQMEFGQV